MGILGDHRNNPPQIEVNREFLAQSGRKKKSLFFKRRAPFLLRENTWDSRTQTYEHFQETTHYGGDFSPICCEKTKPNKCEKKIDREVCHQGWGERVGAGESQSWRDSTIFLQLLGFLLMTACRQHVSSEDARKNIKGRGRRINMFCCHFQERDGVPTSLPQQVTRKRK